MKNDRALTPAAQHPADARPMTVRVIDSPIGPLTIAGRGNVVHHLRMHEQQHAPIGAADWQAAPDAFPDVIDQLDAYFAGQLTRFDVAIALGGTPFQKRVWEALLDIPYGSTERYGDLARRLGDRNASRAVGLANGRNPIAIIVPCHRVIGAGGRLVGYGGGLDRKRFLLDLERTPQLVARP